MFAFDTKMRTLLTLTDNFIKCLVVNLFYPSIIYSVGYRAVHYLFEYTQ